jgi:hypothetical protein
MIFLPFILIIFFIHNEAFSSVFWVCPNNYGSDFEYNIENKEIFIKLNNKWQLLHDKRNNNIIKKIYENKRIIYFRFIKDKNIVYKEVFDLDNTTIKIYSKPEYDNHSFKLLSAKQCSLL